MGKSTLILAVTALWSFPAQNSCAECWPARRAVAQVQLGMEFGEVVGIVAKTNRVFTAKIFGPGLFEIILWDSGEILTFDIGGKLIRIERPEAHFLSEVVMAH